MLSGNDLKEAFEQHRRSVFAFAWRMIGSAVSAEDVTQEVFLSAWKDRSRFDAARGDVRGYLFGIARNLCLNHLR